MNECILFEHTLFSRGVSVNKQHGSNQEAYQINPYSWAKSQTYRRFPKTRICSKRCYGKIWHVPHGHRHELGRTLANMSLQCLWAWAVSLPRLSCLMTSHYAWCSGMMLPTRVWHMLPLTFWATPARGCTMLYTSNRCVGGWRAQLGAWNRDWGLGIGD